MAVLTNIDLTYENATVGEVHSLPRMFPEVEGSGVLLTITAKDEHGVEGTLTAFGGQKVADVSAIRFTADQNKLTWGVTDVE